MPYYLLHIGVTVGVKEITKRCSWDFEDFLSKFLKSENKDQLENFLHSSSVEDEFNVDSSILR